MQNSNLSQVKITKEVVRSRCSEGKLLNQYRKIRKIGEGPFSKIKLMVDTRTGSQYAMKKYNLFILRKKIKMTAKSAGQTKYTTQADQVHKQIEIMKQVRHENIAVLHEIIEDEEEEKIYLFMDYCKYGDVADWDAKSKHIAKFFRQAAEALEYLHSLNIVHRDIKPQNILITETDNAKLIDFGRSAQLKSAEERLAGSQGTYHFMAPEMLTEKMPGGYDGKLCDIWSLGVSLFCCVFKVLPFYDPILIKLFQKIEKCEFEIPGNSSAGELKFAPLIRSMLELDWTKRPSLASIRKALSQIEDEI